MSYAACVIGVIAILASVLLLLHMKRKYKIKDNGVRDIALSVRRGSVRVIVQELVYRVPIMGVIFFLLFFFVGNITAALFLVGTLVSIFSVVLAIKAEAMGSVRASEAAYGDREKAYRLIYRTAAAVGLGIAGFGLLIMVFIYWALGISTLVSAMAGFGLGISANALLGRTADRAFSGIFDLLDSYACSVIAVMTLAYTAVRDAGVTASFSERMAVVFPLGIIATGLAVTLPAVLSFRVRTDENAAVRAMNRRLYGTAAVTAAVSGVLCWRYLASMYYFWAILAGILSGVLAEILSATINRKYNVVSEMNDTEADAYQLMKRRIGASMALNILLILLIAGTVYIAGTFTGSYGVALAAAGMAAVSVVKMTEGAFLSVSYSTSSIQGLAGAPGTVRTGQASNLLQNGAATIRGGGSAVITAALTSFAMMLSFANYAHLTQADLLKPRVMTCALLGILLPFLYAGLEARSGRAGGTDTLMAAAWQKAGNTEKGGLLTGIFDNGRFSSLVFPGIIAMLIPVVSGFLFGAEALCALVASATLASIMMSVVCANSSRRYAMVSGTSINILMKSLAVVTLALVSVFSTGIL